MKQEIEEELCLQRIALIIATNKRLADKLIEIGYPHEYPEKFKNLEKAYKNLEDALLGLICEELMVLKNLKQLCRQ